MKRLFVVFISMLIGLSQADDIKLYGIISYLSANQLELRIDDLSVLLTEAEIDGFLSLGALVEIEGNWRDGVFIAEEVEVKSSVEPDLFIYRGQVINGMLLGLEFESLPEGQWLELTTQLKEGHRQLLLIRPLVNTQSAVQATVETLTEDGFIAAGVRVISPRDVKPGDQIRVTGQWVAEHLVEDEM